MARSPYCARPFCVCTIEGGNCQAVVRETNWFRKMWTRHLTIERAEATILGMSYPTDNAFPNYVRPSDLRPGYRVGTAEQFFYTVMSEPAEQPDGSIHVMVQYADGGRSIREWDVDRPQVPVRL